jgi:hypothetical protein
MSLTFGKALFLTHCQVDDREIQKREILADDLVLKNANSERISKLLRRFVRINSDSTLGTRSADTMHVSLL